MSGSWRPGVLAIHLTAAGFAAGGGAVGTSFAGGGATGRADGGGATGLAAGGLATMGTRRNAEPPLIALSTPTSCQPELGARAWARAGSRSLRKTQVAPPRPRARGSRGRRSCTARGSRTRGSRTSTEAGVAFVEDQQRARPELALAREARARASSARRGRGRPRARPARPAPASRAARAWTTSAARGPPEHHQRRHQHGRGRRLTEAIARRAPGEPGDERHEHAHAADVIARPPQRRRAGDDRRQDQRQQRRRRRRAAARLRARDVACGSARTQHAKKAAAPSGMTIQMKPMPYSMAWSKYMPLIDQGSAIQVVEQPGQRLVQVHRQAALVRRIR